MTNFFTTFFLFSVPGDSSWVVLDSNGSSNRELESQGPSQQPEKMDIFSQAMASAEIDEFAANNSKQKKLKKNIKILTFFHFSVEITTDKVPEPTLVTPKTNTNVRMKLFPKMRFFFKFFFKFLDHVCFTP